MSSSIFRASRVALALASRQASKSCISSAAFKAPVASKSIAAPVFNIFARSFGAAAGNAAPASETFMDAKIVADRVIEVVKNFEKVTASKVTPESRFKEDLNLDSLDAVEVVMAIEEEFAIEIPDSEADKILSIADAVNYIANHPMAK